MAIAENLANSFIKELLSAAMDNSIDTDCWSLMGFQAFDDISHFFITRLFVFIFSRREYRTIRTIQVT